MCNKYSRILVTVLNLNAKFDSGLELHTGQGGLCLRCPGLGLGALSNIPMDLKIFQWKCPFQNENGLAL